MARKQSSENPPAAPVKAGKPSTNLDTRVIYCGDNLEQLKRLPPQCVDLIYIDPPFNSDRNYEVFWGETKEKRAFADRHESTKAYIDYRRPRCVELERVLKPTGSFYYHCDDHASHYVKVMLDQIFGENNFQSEIIWHRTLAKGLAFTGFPNNHDTIFFYGGGAGSGELTFNRPYNPYDPDNLDERTATKYCHRDPDGRVYRLDNLLNPNPDRPNLTYEFMGVKRVWRWTKDRMQEAYDNGIVVQTKPGSVPQMKRYLDEQEGRPIATVWTDIPPSNSQAKERLGYPTQKPLALLDRIIRASSKENDIVCRVALKVGKVCAIKTGMGLKHRAVEQNDRFGGGVRGVAEVVNVAVGTEAADDCGPGWGGNGLAERTAGDGAVVGDADARALAPDIGPPGTGRCGPDDRAFFGAGLVVGRLRGLMEFAVDFMLVGVRDQLVQQLVGTGQIKDLVGGQEGDPGVSASSRAGVRFCLWPGVLGPSGGGRRRSGGRGRVG